MTEKMLIVSIEVVTDDDTGIYRIGELDYALPMTGFDWIAKHRTEFAAFLRDLADRAQNKLPPFHEHNGSGCPPRA